MGTHTVGGAAPRAVTCCYKCGERILQVDDKIFEASPEFSRVRTMINGYSQLVVVHIEHECRQAESVELARRTASGEIEHVTVRGIIER